MLLVINQNVELVLRLTRAVLNAKIKLPSMKL